MDNDMAHEPACRVVRGRHRNLEERPVLRARDARHVPAPPTGEPCGRYCGSVVPYRARRKDLPMWRRRAGLTAIALGAVSVAWAASHGEAQSSNTAAVERTTVDRVDDIHGPQVHFLYVVPSDGTDRELDTNGTLDASIARIQRWMVSQTQTLSLRIDTYQGAPDVTFVRLPHSDAQATSRHPWPLWVIGEDLVAAGFNNPDKVYAVFYDGRSSWACGGAKSPALPKLGAMYLQAWPTNDPHPCAAAPGFGSGDDSPGYFEIGLLHEVLHTIGFAPSCAPHVTQTDHVNDSPTDLMYHPDAQSPAPWDWPHAVLDYNHDDYFGDRTPSGCPNLRDSPVLAPTGTFRFVLSVEGRGSVQAGQLGSCTAERPCGPVSLAAGSTVTLSPAAAAGWRLAAWRGADCPLAGDCVLTVGADREITAVFEPKPTVTLSVSWSRGGFVRLAPGGTYGRSFTKRFPQGARLTLIALPRRNFRFARWSGSCRGTRVRCALVLGRNTTVRVTFVRR